MPIIKEELITINKYKFNGVYNEERTDLHRIILSNKIQGTTSSDSREAILVGGGSGAGKSTIIKQFFLPNMDKLDSNSDFVYIDADDIKLKLDEYKEYIQNEETVYYAAFYVHAESGDIVNMLLQECIDRELSFIYDGTMSWKPLYDDLLLKLKAKAYNTLGVYIDVDLETALNRAIKRGDSERRYVAPEIVKKANRNSAIVFKQIKLLFDAVMMFNNTEDRTEESNLETIPFYKRVEPLETLFAGELLNKEQLDLFIKKSELPYIE